MCRIAGLINPSMPVAAIEAVVKEMCTVQKHGGPDDEGMFTDVDNHLVLGHRRLSLIDLSAAGHQPMRYSGGRYTISYNGELYNYLELKAKLQKAGATFTTHSDTEVILAAFAYWGVAAFQQFNGMFAFAIWDIEKGVLYLVRDPAGIKPLYFAHTKEGLAFASEVRAFKGLGYLQQPHPHWQVYLMAYGHLPEPVTTLKEVQPLKKGWFLHYNVKSGECRQEPFNRFNYVEQISDRPKAIELVQKTLAAAVKRHLLSDAPIGVFLSGGLDSSIIASLANKAIPDLNTISLVFDEALYSEKKYQDIVQLGLQGQQHQHLLTASGFHADMPAIMQAMDLPCSDGINTWFISKYARQQGLKAVLSGIGGDELFGGYPSFNRIAAALQVKQYMPPTVLRNGKIPGIKKLRRFCYLSLPGSVGMYLFLRGQFIPAEIAAYLDMPEGAVWDILQQQPQVPDITNLTPKNQASWLEINLYMQNQLLRDADVMSMAHGVEIRVPFLDATFLKLVLQLCSSIKYPGSFNKQLLIDSFKAEIPAAVWNRPKMGFSFPFKEWFGDSRYAAGKTGSGTALFHKKFTRGNLHWSQFFTIYLMENQLHA
ncbi:asparagine synthase (glutamine-hydrolyzing) [soil metagenome]